MWAASALIVMFLGAIVLTAVTQAVAAAEPCRDRGSDKPFGAYRNSRNPPCIRWPTAASSSRSLAGMFSFAPDPIEVPANVPITFRLTSQDVMHGFQVVGTNANAMAIPGYVSQFTVTFAKPGEYTIACNEYCGLMHHAMVGKLVVK